MGALVAWSAAVRAEDIGREPLAPRDGAASLSLRGPSQSQGNESTGSGGTVLAPRGPAASAEHPPVDAGSDYRPRRRWYGWQTLIVDGASTLALVAIASRSDTDSDDAWLTGLAVAYSAAPPIIHLAHGHPGKALLSLGIRAVGPLLIASSISDHDPALAVFGVLAIPAAISIDAAAIAREDVPTDGGGVSFLQRLAFTPWVDTRRGAGGLMLGFSL